MLINDWNLFSPMNWKIELCFSAYCALTKEKKHGMNRTLRTTTTKTTIQSARVKFDWNKNMTKEIYHEGWLIKSPPTKRIWRAVSHYLFIWLFYYCFAFIIICLFWRVSRMRNRFDALASGCCCCCCCPQFCLPDCDECNAVVFQVHFFVHFFCTFFWRPHMIRPSLRLTLLLSSSISRVCSCKFKLPSYHMTAHLVLAIFFSFRFWILIEEICKTWEYSIVSINGSRGIGAGIHLLCSSQINKYHFRFFMNWIWLGASFKCKYISKSSIEKIENCYSSGLDPHGIHQLTIQHVT